MQMDFRARNIFPNMLANDILAPDSYTTELSAISQPMKGWLANLQHLFFFFFILAKIWF